MAINSSTEILKKDNTIASFEEVTLHTKTATDATLTTGEYSIVNQQEVDGKWYVKLVLKD